MKTLNFYFSDTRNYNKQIQLLYKYPNEREYQITDIISIKDVDCNLYFSSVKLPEFGKLNVMIQDTNSLENSELYTFDLPKGNGIETHTMFIDIDFERKQRGYRGWFSNDYQQNKFEYALYFIHSSMTVEFYQLLFAYIDSQKMSKNEFSYLMKGICEKIIDTVLPKKMRKDQNNSNDLLFYFNHILQHSKEIIQQRAYQFSFALWELKNNFQNSQQTLSEIDSTQNILVQQYKTIDWLKELSGQRTIQSSDSEIIDILEGKLIQNHFDSDIDVMITEMTKFKYNNNNQFRNYKKNAVLKASRELKDFQKVSFFLNLFEISDEDYKNIAIEFISDLVQINRNKSLPRECKRSLVTSSKQLMKMFDNASLILLQIFDENSFKYDLNDKEKQLLLETFTDNNIQVNYEWKSLVLRSYKHEQFEFLERAFKITNKLNPFIYWGQEIKSYFFALFQKYPTPNMYEILYIKQRFSQLLQQQFQIQQTQQYHQIEQPIEEEEDSFQEQQFLAQSYGYYNQGYQQSWSNNYNQNRKNKREFGEKRLTEDDIKKIENELDSSLHQHIGSQSLFLMIQDTLTYSQINTIDLPTIQKTFFSYFSNKIADEWKRNTYFKDKFLNLRQLKAEKNIKSEIASFILKKYTENAIQFYVAKRNLNPPFHFCNDDIVTFIEETIEMEESRGLIEKINIDLNDFLNGFNFIALDVLKKFLKQENAVKRLFNILNKDFKNFKQSCHEILNLYQNKSEQINDLFQNFQAFFKEEQQIFYKEFNLQQKTGDIKYQMSKFTRILPYTDFNLFFRNSQIYLNIKKLVLHNSKGLTEQQVFNLIRSKMEWVLRQLTQKENLEIQVLQKFKFEASQKPEQKIEVQNESQSNEMANPCQPQQQEQPSQCDLEYIKILNLQKKELLQKNKEKEDQEKAAQEFPIDSSVLHLISAQLQINTTTLTITELKNLCGGTYTEAIHNILGLLKLTEQEIDGNEFGRQLFEIYAIDFIREYYKDIKDILAQYSIQIETNILHFSTYNAFKNILSIKDYNKLPIFKIALPDFKDALQCYEPVTFFNPKLIQIVRRMNEIIQFTIENLSNQQEGRGFLDLNDLIDDEDVDISSLLIKLNQLSPFIYSLSSIRRNQQPPIQALKVLIDIFSSIRQFITKDEDCITLEECINNFYKIKNIQMSFDKKKSYIVLSQQIVKEGQIIISFKENKEVPDIIVQVEGKIYSEEEIQQICSKVIIEQNTTNIVINWQRRNTSGAIMAQQGDQNMQQECQILKQTIEKFKKQWSRVGDLKELLLQLKLFGYFDSNNLQLEYVNKSEKSDATLQAMNKDLNSLQSLLDSWKSLIEERCQQFPLFTLIGHNFYKEMFEYLILAKPFDKLHPDLQDILKLAILKNQFSKFQILDLVSIQKSLINKDTPKTQQLFQKVQVEKNNKLTPQQKLDKIAQWFGQIQKDSMVSQIVKSAAQSTQKKQVSTILYSGNQELVNILYALMQKMRREGDTLEFYQYFYCDSYTQIQDLDLFMYRLQYFIQDESKQYVLVMNAKLDAKQTLQICESINNIQKQSNVLFNRLLICSRRDYYGEYLSNLHQITIDDFLIKQKAYNTKSKTQRENLLCQTQFYFSKYPGEGKTYQIQKIFSALPKKLNSLRISINGTGDKSQLIELFRQRIEKCERDKPMHIHIDVYPYDVHDLNMLLFEIIQFKQLSIHQKSFVNLGQFVNFYIEINNTLSNELSDSLFIKTQYQNVQVGFSIKDYQPIPTIIGDQNYKFACVVYNYLKKLSMVSTVANYFDTPQSENVNTASTNPNQMTLSNISVEQEFTIDSHELFQKLLQVHFLDYLTGSGIRPCFHQLSNFIKLFGSEMLKFEKCYFLQKDILKELEPQLLVQGIRTSIVQQSRQLSFNVSTNQTRNIPSNQQGQRASNTRERILHEKAECIQRFSELMASFVTFQEQDFPSLTSFFPTSNDIPKSIMNLYEIQGAKNELITFDKFPTQQKALEWLNMLLNKDSANSLSPQVLEKIKRLEIQRDNFFKIAMIFMRVRSQSPIILMGEAGSGKTAMIELLSALIDAKFFSMNVHAGITEAEVIDFILTCSKSNEWFDQKVIIFFDEMNTSKLVQSIFKEIIVDRCLKGMKIPDHVVPIAAINPYKLKGQQQKKLFDMQVHGGIKKEVMSRMNNTDLEYMVEPLPDSLYSFIWNIDHLSKEEEDQYINKIVQFKNNEQMSKNKDNFNSKQISQITSDLSYSQQYLRKIMGSYSACSLRDIVRFTKLLFWFIKFLQKCIKLGLTLKDYKTCASNLAFYINYSVRIPLYQQRDEYESIIFGKNEFSRDDVQKVQSFLADQIEVPRGIIKNTALKQNILTLFASIMNKIPVVLIGQPGCSKSLSLKLLIQSLRGDQSKSKLFESMKTLVPIYYQGHMQSTSDKILEVFNTANKKQQMIEQDNQKKKYLSLVYLEEIGLAEISPHNPLKVLHQTLEQPKVAVACISNWPLDSSKMNRMLSVYRLDTSASELRETVISTFEEVQSLEKDESIKSLLIEHKLNPTFVKCIVDIYSDYKRDLSKFLIEHEQFHGLRDFYGMAKLFAEKYYNQLVKIIQEQSESNNNNKESKNIEVSNQIGEQLITDSYLRHFSGLKKAQVILSHGIKNNLRKMYADDLKMDDRFSLPSLSRDLKMIDQNLQEKSNNFLSRHLMIISQNTQKSLDYIQERLQSLHKPIKVFLGSDFPDDKRSENSFQTINEIISCVEQGICVVLQNLDHVYQSLYELLNQNYHYYNGKYFCRVSLGADKSNVEVSRDFKLILIANQSQIPYLSGPLLNRFEKQIFETSMLIGIKDTKDIQSIQQYFTDGKENSNNVSIFNFANVNQIIESCYLQQKSITKESDQLKNKVTDKLLHLAPFKKILLSKNCQSMIKDYLDSKYHYSLEDFIRYRILDYKESSDVKNFCVFSTQQFSSSQKMPQESNKVIQQKIIYLSEIISQNQLMEKFSEFFQNAQIRYKLNPSIISTLFVICDIQTDSLERIIFTKQKIDEFRQNISPVVLINVIVTIKVIDNFTMIPLQNGWEHYYIEELNPLQNIQCTQIKQQINLKQVFESLNINLLQFFQIDSLFSSFLNSSENISLSYSRVQYGQNIINYRTQRLEQQKMILLNPINSVNLTSFRQIVIQILSIRMKYLLDEIGLTTVEDFVYNWVIKKGFIHQASGLLRALVSGLEDLMQSCLSFCITAFELEQIIYLLYHSHNEENNIYKIVEQRILRRFNIKQNESRLLDVNQAFISKGMQLLSISQNLLFPIDQSIVLDPVSKIIQKQILYESSMPQAQEIGSLAQLIIRQIKEIISPQNIQLMELYDSKFCHDYFLVQQQNFNKQDSQILELLLSRNTQNIKSLNKLENMIYKIILFERHQKSIIQANQFIENFKKDLKFNLSDYDFLKFNEGPNKNNSIDDMKYFNVFIIHSVFWFLFPNTIKIAQQWNPQHFYKLIIKYISQIEVNQYDSYHLTYIINISKIVLSFFDEVVKNRFTNMNALKDIKFLEINMLNLEYISSLKKDLLEKLTSKKEITIEQKFMANLMDTTTNKANLKPEAQQQNKLTEKQQFERSWCRFISLVMQLNSKQAGSKNMSRDLLKFLVDLEISMKDHNPNILQQIFNVLIYEQFNGIDLHSMNSIFTQEALQPTLRECEGYHTEHYSLVILSQLIQESIVRPMFNNSSAANSVQTLNLQTAINIIFQNNFSKLTILQKIIYFSVFREVVNQIFINEYRPKSIFADNIYVTDQLLSNYFKYISSEPLKIYILKQIFKNFRVDPIKKIKDHPIFSVPWIQEAVQSFQKITDTNFFNYNQTRKMKLYFQDSKLPFDQQIISYMSQELRSSRNAFAFIYDGWIGQNYYPFMMYNNIQILLDRDPNNNKQLYQCQKCFEFIFSDQCPELQSKHCCLQCGEQIALNNTNTKRVLQDAQSNLVQLQNVINENQWKGYYCFLQEDKPDFKMNEGTSFDLRLMSIIYNIAFLLAMKENKKYLEEQKETIKDRTGTEKIVTTRRINKILRINYEANAEDHLKYQIQIAIKHCKQYMTQLYGVKEEDFPYIMFKLIDMTVNDYSVRTSETPLERSVINQSIAKTTQQVFEDLKTLVQVEQSLSKKILEIEFDIDIPTNCKRNLRNFDQNNRIESLLFQLNEKIPNQSHQILKRLLNMKDINWIVKVLHVFIKFYQEMNREFSNKFSLSKAFDTSIGQLLKEENKTQLYYYYIQQFLPVWEELRMKEKVFEIGCESIDIPRFDANTKLNFLIFGESKNQGSFRNGLEMIVSQYNNFLNTIYQLSQINNSNEQEDVSNNQNELREMFETSDNQMKKKTLDQVNLQNHIIKPYNQQILREYVFSNLEYGQGSGYILDLQELELRLAKDVLKGSVVIDLESTIKFKYLLEVHQIGMLSNIAIPQQTIMQETRNKVKQILTNKEQAFEFLQQLSTVFQMYKAESQHGELTIKSALDSLQLNLKQESLKEILSSQLKLKSLSDLICCVEEIQLENLVELCNPFYKQPIEQELSEVVIRFAQKRLFIDEMIIALGRFTIRCLSSESATISPKENLFQQIFYTDIYSELWRDPDQIDKLFQEASKIPVTIGQSYSLFQTLLKYKDTQIVNKVEEQQQMQNQNNQKSEEFKYIL